MLDSARLSFYPPCHNLICKQTNLESSECGRSKLILGLKVYPWKSTLCFPPELNHEHGSSQPVSCSVRNLVPSPRSEETGKAGEATRLSHLAIAKTITSLTCLPKMLFSAPIHLLASGRFYHVFATDKKQSFNPERRHVGKAMTEAWILFYVQPRHAPGQVFFMEQWWGVAHKIANTPRECEQNEAEMVCSTRLGKAAEGILRIACDKQEPATTIRIKDILDWRDPGQTHTGWDCLSADSWEQGTGQTLAEPKLCLLLFYWSKWLRFFWPWLAHPEQELSPSS